MKNIHVLKTENYKEDYKLQNSDAVIQVVKLGQLIFDSSLKEFRINKNSSWVASCDTDVLIPQNIYITSDEEIKEGDWCISLCDDESYGEIYQCKDVKLVDEEDKKIILTTDQELITDGVQAIDDKFLEWFCKNSSCEEIYVNKIESFDFGIDKYVYNYKIIIPKEEPKEETLEQVAQKIFPVDFSNYDINNGLKQEGFITGAKWKDERMYSEEEVKHLMTLAFEQGFKKSDIVEAGLEAKETDTEVNWIFLKHKK